MPEPENQPAAIPPPPKKKLLRRMLIAGGALCAIIAISLVAALLYFNDNYFKARIQAAIKDGLGRESEISSLQISFVGGSVSIDGLRIFNANSKDKDTFHCEK